MRYLCVIISLFMFSSTSSAGLFELSAQTSMKNTSINSDSNSEARSASGSIAYYFWQSGALEFTYMEGYNFTRGVINSSTKYEQVLNYRYKGVDLIYNLGNKQSTINPYIKAGLAEIEKDLEYKQNGVSEIGKQKSNGKNMTYGAGIKIKISKTLSIRFSYDVWKGPIDNDDVDATTDSSTKVGLSWYL